MRLDLASDRYAHDHRVQLKERSCSYPPNKEKGKCDGGSDDPLSSLSSARELVLHEQAQLTNLTSTCGFHQRARS